MMTGLRARGCGCVLGRKAMWSSGIAEEDFYTISYTFHVLYQNKGMGGDILA